jgi:hypothetical protein
MQPESFCPVREEEVVPPRSTEERLHELGTDPRSGCYRQGEAECAVRLERQVGLLVRDSSGAFDWFDSVGRSYDAVGPVPPQYFNAQSFTRQIDQHLLKTGLDRVVVDLTGLSPTQRATVEVHIARLSAEQQARILVV